MQLPCGGGGGGAVVVVFDLVFSLVQSSYTLLKAERKTRPFSCYLFPSYLLLSAIINEGHGRVLPATRNGNICNKKSKSICIWD